MKLTGFDLYSYSLPLTGPLVLKDATLRRRDGLLLRLAGEDGAVGWGETSPLPGFSRESLADAARELRGLAAAIVGRKMEDGWIGAHGTLARELDHMDSAPSVRFGLETACWNLYAAARGTTLPELVSASPRAVVPVNGLLAGPPAEVLKEARRMRDVGYEAIKLKVGGRSVKEDIDLVCGVKEVLERDVSLRLDANRAWSFEEGLRFARGVEGGGIEYIEEPLADPDGLEEFARACGIPVALDESLVGMSPETLDEHSYAEAVVIKPTLLGGVSHTLRLAGRALELGIRPVMSSSYESGVGTAALVALAAGIGEAPAGLDTYRRFAEDVVEPRLRLPAPRLDVRDAVMRGVVYRRISRVEPPR